MNIALGLAFLVAVAVLEGVTGLPEEHFIYDNEIGETEENLVQESEPPPWDRQRWVTLCRRKLGGRCVKRRKQCPGHLPKEASTGRSYCSKGFRCCHSEILSPEGFMFEFNKKYENKAEAEKRIKIFKENVKEMEDHNKLYESGNSSYSMGVNEFSDMTFEEVISQLTGIDSSVEAKVLRQSSDWYVPIELGKEPPSLDYRKKGAVNSVRNQGGCGSCWAFSTIGTIEGVLAKKTGSLVKLSEQDLVDCKRGSCKGAWPEWAIAHIASEGIASRHDYPYKIPDEFICKKDVNRTYPVIGHQRVRKGNETELLNALVHVGPISIVTKISSHFSKYSKGVLIDELCLDDSDGLHAMTLVGYGTENGQDYWLVRNSWGKSHGEKGYIKYARNKDNHCRIASYGDVPILKDNKPLPENISYKDGIAYKEIWNDRGSGGSQDLSIWRAGKVPSGFCSLGDVAIAGYTKPRNRTILVASGTSAVAHPVSFNKIWTDAGSGAHWDVAVYTMNAPYGYTCLGGVAMRSHRTEPNKYSYCCIHKDYLVPADVVETYKETGTGANKKLSLWTIVNGSGNHGMAGGNFWPVNGYDKPSRGVLLNDKMATEDTN